MITTTMEQLLHAGLQHHQSGRLPEAEALYRQVLAQQPGHPVALRLLGALAGQVGRQDIAIDLLQQALAAKPDFPEAWFDLGNARHALGQFAEASDCFERATVLAPGFSAAFNNLGNALQARSQTAASIAACRKALALQPQFPEAFNNLGNALQASGLLDEALAAYESAMALKPDFAVACFNLGNVWRAKGQDEQAVTWYRKALALAPAFPEAHFNHGSTLQAQGRTDAALACYQQAIGHKPDFFEAHRQLGDLLQARGRLDEAIGHHRTAIRLKPDCAIVYNELGNALKSCGLLAEAVEAYRQHLARDPGSAIGYNNLGVAFMDLGNYEQAVASLQKAVALDPTHASPWANLGSAYKDMGQLDESLAAFRRGLELAPDSAVIHSKLCYTLYFHPAYDTRLIHEEECRWNQCHAAPLKQFITPHINDRTPGRRLRIGYVSPDFRNHAEAYFVVPLLEGHDHDTFEVHCYASVMRPDAVTERLRRAADIWHDVLGQSDEELAALIRHDEIDILIDLTMHMANNRMLAFARKPAPVQVIWLAYPGSTGLTAIDYRISDAYLDPPGMELACYSETTIRLPDYWVCYDALIDTARAAPRAITHENPLCFGSLNNPCKLNAEMLELWTRILQTLPGSRLLLLAGSADQQRLIIGIFAQGGIEPERIEFIGYHARPAYLRLYDRIDIALDPLPYSGITTSCDALWMGVPVVTMAGQTAAGRAGVGILSTIGLPELIANTPDDYVRIACDLARDEVRLAALRCGLRQQTKSSALMNGRRFAQHMEAAYRQMWQTWCEADDRPAKS